jgi:hypothetical protein
MKIKKSRRKLRSKSRRIKKYKGGNNIINNLTYMVYTHFEYDDILEILLKQHNKHFPIMPIIIATNNKKHIQDKYLPKYNFIKNIYEYDDSKPYYEKLKSVVENVKTKYVLYNPDSFVLIGHVEISGIENFLNKMNTDNIDQLRLNASGIDNFKIVDGESYHLVTGPYFMSVGSAIWNTKSLLDIATKFIMKTYKESENGNVQEYVKLLKNYYFTSSKNLKNDWMGVIPDIIPLLKIISKGKYRRNIQQVVELLKSYNVPPNVRSEEKI